MKLGISTYACTWAIGIPGNVPEHPLSVTGFLDLAHEHGFSLVQIADNLPLDKLSGKELQSLKKHADDLGIDIEVGTRGLDDDTLSKYLEIAVMLQSPILRVVAAKDPVHPTKEQILAALKRWEPHARSRGIRIGLENHDTMPCKDLQFIMESIASPYVGICLDTVNSFGALEGPKYVMDTLAPYVVNIHLKDFKIYRPEFGLGFILEGTPAGDGQLDIMRLLNDPYIQDKQNLTAILELWVPKQETLEQSIALERQWIGKSAWNLKGKFTL